MTHRHWSLGRFTRGLVAAALVLLLPAIAAPAVAASDLSFGTPSASSVFLKGIDFSQPVSGGSGLSRVEIVIAYPDAAGPAATEIEPTAGGIFAYHLDTSKGQLVPNTTLVAHWRVTFDDGSQRTGPDVRVTYADDRFAWQTRSSKLIRLHWYQGDDAFATRALDVGEQGVEKAAATFGTTEKTPIDFFVYADQAAFLAALGPGTPEDVGGQAHSDIRTLFALITPNDVATSWVSSVVPHELTHIVFDDVVRNPYHSAPHWLNEGLAVYLSDGFAADNRSRVQSAAANGSLMPLDGIRDAFPTPDDRFRLGYAESVSAVDYLIRTYGRQALQKLVQTYGTGASDDEAFRAATGLDMAAFDRAWMTANGQATPQTYGPRPAPAGPLPPGWTSAGAGQPNPAQPGTSAAAPASAPAEGTAPAAQPGAAHDSGRDALLVAGALIAIAAAMLLLALLLFLKSRRAGRTP